MAKPGEHKTVQARILAYAHDLGWTYVSRADAEARRGFDSEGATPADRARAADLYFGDLLHQQITTFNPEYREAEGALVGELCRLRPDIFGNRDFLAYLRNETRYFDTDDDRERDLRIIDYDDLARTKSERQNVYEVTEELYCPQRALRHARGRRLPHQRHPGAC